MAANDNQQEDRGSGKSEEVEEEEKTDGWLTTYSDMVTLLLTFFVLMFALSNVDQQKAMLLFAGFSREGLSAEKFAEIQAMFAPSDDAEPGGILPPLPTPDKNADPEAGMSIPELDELEAMIKDYIAENELGDTIAVVYNGEYLLLTLANDFWFESGSAEISDEIRESALVLGQLIFDNFSYEKPFEVVVAGHTDNVPINTVRYPSNWHVSVARAVNLLEVLLEDTGLEGAYFMARGCGEERPIDDNETPEGRQRNRRAEIYISMAREMMIDATASFEAARGR